MHALLLLLLLQTLQAAPADVSMRSAPRQFRKVFDRAVVDAIIATAAELGAKSGAVDFIVRLLQTGTSSGRAALTVNGQALTVDRVAVAGSVGQKVSVQGMFDIDLVVFINVPSAVVTHSGSSSASSSSGIVIDVADPDATQNSTWMQQLRHQLVAFLEANLPVGDEVQLKPTAITVKLLTHLAGNSSMEVDILLAPNLAGSSGDREQAQCRAVLTPLLTAANDRIRGSSSNSHSRQLVRSSFARSIWLAGSYTSFCRDAAAAGGIYGRLVTTTIRLVKAWIRKGLQPHWPGFKHFKSFMIGLLVLEAAKQLKSQQQQGSQYEGRYVLDLLFPVLETVQVWAADAALSAAGAEVEPVLFTSMAREKYYTRQQALELQAVLQVTAPRETWWGASRGQPVVVHPIDPLFNIFNQTVQFKLWEEFSAAAAELAYDLKHESWGYISTKSSLAPVFAGM